MPGASASSSWRSWADPTVSDESDLEATQLRPRPTPQRGAVPTGAWDNIAAWVSPSEAEASTASSAADADEPQAARPSRSLGDQSAARSPANTTGPRRSAAPAPPAAARDKSRVWRPSKTQVAAGVLVGLTVVALIIPTLLSPAETATGRAITVAHGPLPRRAEAAKLPAGIGDLRRDAGADAPALPFGQVDRAQYVDGQNARRVIVLAQRVDVRSLEEYDQRQGMQATRFGRVSCGRRAEALQCTMLLDGGTLSATTIAPAWQPEDLARFVRQAYAGLPQ